MAIITKPNTFSAGATIIASEHNENFDTIYSDHNGNITNANISNSAAIAKSKLNLTAGITDSDIASTGITSAGKVDGAAITNIDNIPSGAGVIPSANLPGWGTVETGKSEGTVYQAPSDGLVFLMTQMNGGGQYVTFYKDAVDATTAVCSSPVQAAAPAPPWIIPIKKNWYYKIVKTGTIDALTYEFWPKQ